MSYPLSRLVASKLIKGTPADPAADKSAVTPATKKMVLRALADYADRDGTRAFPSHATVSAETGLDRKKIRAAIPALIDDGLLLLVNPARKVRTNERVVLVEEYKLLVAAIMALPNAVLYRECDAVDGGDPSPASVVHHGGEVVFDGGESEADAGEIEADDGDRSPQLCHLTQSKKTYRSCAPERRTAHARAHARDVADSFEEFWEVYPHRNGKKLNRKRAVRQFTLAVERTTAEDIIAGAKAAAQYDKDLAPDADRWLKEDRWMDEYPGRPTEADRARRRIPVLAERCWTFALEHSLWPVEIAINAIWFEQGKDQSWDAWWSLVLSSYEAGSTPGSDPSCTCFGVPLPRRPLPKDEWADAPAAGEKAYFELAKAGEDVALRNQIALSAANAARERLAAKAAQSDPTNDEIPF